MKKFKTWVCPCGFRHNRLRMKVCDNCARPRRKNARVVDNIVVG